MLRFGYCISHLLLILGLWFSCGFGLATAFSGSAKRERQLRSALLLAPILGYASLACIGLLRLNFLQPLSPDVTATIVLVASAVLTVSFKKNLKPSRLTWSLPLLHVPLGFALCFSLMFNHSGLELLSGAEDEIGYCTNASQMLVQNTLSPDDVIVGRADHWAYDFMARFQTYWVTYRREAEATLAILTRLFKLPIYLMFPLLSGSICTALLLGIGSLATDCWNVARKKTVLVQLGASLLFYLTLLHVQGCLANLSSLPLYLCGLAFLSIAFYARTPIGWAWLSAFMLSAACSFYTEVSSIEAVLPVVIVTIVHVWHARFKISKKFWLKLAAFALTFLLVVNFDIRNVWLQATGNASTVAASIKGKSDARRNEIGEADAICGVLSYYDSSKINVKIMEWSNAHQSLVVALLLLLLWLPALVGFWLTRAESSGLFTVFLLLSLVVTGLSFAHDSFRLFRGIEYLLPYSYLGLAIGAFKAPIRWVQRACFVLFVLFVGVNACTEKRTFKYLSKNDWKTERMIGRLNPLNSVWTDLNKTLSEFPTEPVLISGFPSHVPAHLIVAGIEPHPNFLSRAILKDWPILNTQDQLLAREKQLRYRERSRPLHDEFPLPDWSKDPDRMYNASRQAIVPRFGPVPEEWGEAKDIYSLRRAHFVNVCDVLYRDQYAFALVPSNTSHNGLHEAQRDQLGLFRLLTDSAKFKVGSVADVPYELCVTYDSDSGDIRLIGSGRSKLVNKASQSGALKTVSIFPVTKNALSQIVIEPQGTGSRPAAVKVRKIDLKEIPMGN